MQGSLGAKMKVVCRGQQRYKAGASIHCYDAGVKWMVEAVVGSRGGGI